MASGIISGLEGDQDLQDGDLKVFLHGGMALDLKAQPSCTSLDSLIWELVW